MSDLYDPRHRDVIADPYPAFRRLQDEDPAHPSEVLGGWVLTRFDDVKAGLGDPRLSSDRITPFLEHHARAERPAREGLDALARLVPLWAVFTDPPRHTRLRGLMNKAFTTRAVERVRPRIVALVDDLIDRARPRGRMDVVRDVAYPLPITVIAELIGVPPEASDEFKRWSDDLAVFIGSALSTPDKYERAGRSISAMAEYFRRLIVARRAQPRDDILSSLLAAEERGDVLSEDELVATCIMLLFAGHETTTNLIANGLLALLRHPAEAEALRAAPGLAAAAVEEVLRYDGPTQAMVRVALEDITVHERRIRRGDRVFLLLNAANRDPRRFADPDRLDIRRPDNRHVAFGAGPHFCLGAPLARLEAQIALPALLTRLPGLSLEREAPEWLPSLVFRGMRALPVTFTGSG